MARAPTTADVFNAIAESRRREILVRLAQGEMPVNNLVEALGIPQPQVSKHLRVLRQVGLAQVRREGRVRRYRLNPEALRPVATWLQPFEQFWERQLTGVKKRAERNARESKLNPKSN